MTDESLMVSLAAMRTAKTLEYDLARAANVRTLILSAGIGYDAAHAAAKAKPDSECARLLAELSALDAALNVVAKAGGKPK